MSDRVVVSMSGGVDSSVAAFLLKQDGHEVIGLHLRLLEGAAEPADGGVERVCEKLDIPFHVADCRERFERIVIADFCEEYGRGRTPNPCVLCNRQIKFVLLLQTADRLKAQRIATGHYARVEFDAGRDRYLLKKGEDGISQDMLLPVLPVFSVELSKY